MEFRWVPLAHPSLAQNQEGWKRLLEGNAAWTSITSRIEGESNCYWIDPISRESSHRILRYLHCLPVRHKHRRSVQVNHKTRFLVEKKQPVLYLNYCIFFIILQFWSKKDKGKANEPHHHVGFLSVFAHCSRVSQHVYSDSDRTIWKTKLY